MKLTPDEIKLVVFVLLALLVGVAAKNYRAGHPIELPPRPPPLTAAPKAPADAEEH